MSFITDMCERIYWAACGFVIISIRHGFRAGCKFGWGVLCFQYRAWHKARSVFALEGSEIHFTSYWPQFGDRVTFYLPGVDQTQHPPQEGIVVCINKHKGVWPGDFVIKAQVFVAANSYGETIFEGVIIEIEVGSLVLIDRISLEELLLHSCVQIRAQAIMLAKRQQEQGLLHRVQSKIFGVN